MLEVKQLTLGDLETNCYLAWCPKTLAAVIIDPADNGDFISEQILTLQLKPTAIILTHGHFDHVLGLLELKLNFDLPIYMNPKDDELLSTARQSTKHWLKRDPGPVPPADHDLVENQRITIGHEYLEVIETPGHTPGSVCLFNQEFIFTGDTLFKEAVGRTDFSYSDPQLLKTSLKKIFKLSPHLHVLAGHGEITSLHQEKAHFPVLA